jgi:membrane-bound serine protease (ClpP class)
MIAAFVVAGVVGWCRPLLSIVGWRAQPGTSTAQLVSTVRAQSSDAGAPVHGYVPRPSVVSDRARDIRVVATPGGHVARIPIDGTIDLGLAALVKRALEQETSASALLLDINTLGGRVDAAIQVRDALLASPLKTIAFVHPRAISAGALIALACDVIVVSPGASMGAATPIQLGADGAEPVSEKLVSYFRAEMRTTAEAKGRRGDIAEAMVDASVTIEGLDPADKLLTLDTNSALSSGMADRKASDVAEVLRALGLQGVPVVSIESNWAEQFVRFVTDPVVSGLLMSLGTLGLLIELYSPGLGLPGAVGALALSLFFGGHLIVNLAGLEELIALVLGLGLLALELFVIPGFGVAGIAGILCIVSALVLTLIGLPLDVLLTTGAWVQPLTRVAIALMLTTVGLIVSARFLPRTRAMNKLVLKSKLASNVETKGPNSFVSADESRLVGLLGVAESDLRPVGVARFGDVRIDVVSEGGYIAAGTQVRVREVEGARVVVRPELAEDERV